jgi:hypothetical protein
MRWLILFALVSCTAETGGLATEAPPTTDSSVAVDSTMVSIDSAVEDTGNAIDTTVVDTFVPDTFVPDTFVPDTFVADTMEAGMTCPLGSMLCSTACIDTLADPDHCGACMPVAVCRVGSMCASGICACQPGLTDCTGICIDTKGHPDACGGCANKCDADKRCRNGMCVNVGDSTCPASRPDECPSSDGRKACFDTKRDPMHCGGCATDKRCDSDEVCVDGSCKDYVVGVGCTMCPCTECDKLLKGSKCCDAPPGSAAGRVFCVDGSACPLWLPP